MLHQHLSLKKQLLHDFVDQLKFDLVSKAQNNISSLQEANTNCLKECLKKKEKKNLHVFQFTCNHNDSHVAIQHFHYVVLYCLVL